MGDAGRRPDSKAQGQGAPPLPLPQQRQGADRHKIIFLIYTRQTQHHATQSAAGSGWRAGYGSLLQLLLGAVCAGHAAAGSRESPGSAQGSAAHTKLPRNICLLKGTTILRIHLLGQTSPLEPDPLGCISNTVQVSKTPWKETSVYFLCRRRTTVVSHRVTVPSQGALPPSSGPDLHLPWHLLSNLAEGSIPKHHHPKQHFSPKGRLEEYLLLTPPSLQPRSHTAPTPHCACCTAAHRQGLGCGYRRVAHTQHRSLLLCFHPVTDLPAPEYSSAKWFLHPKQSAQQQPAQKSPQCRATRAPLLAAGTFTQP